MSIYRLCSLFLLALLFILIHPLMVWQPYYPNGFLMLLTIINVSSIPNARHTCELSFVCGFFQDLMTQMPLGVYAGFFASAAWLFRLIKPSFSSQHWFVHFNLFYFILLFTFAPGVFCFVQMQQWGVLGLLIHCLINYIGLGTVWLCLFSNPSVLVVKSRIELICPFR